MKKKRLQYRQNKNNTLKRRVDIESMTERTAGAKLRAASGLIRKVWKTTSE